MEEKKEDAAEPLIKAQREQSGIPDEEWQKAQRFVAEIGAPLCRAGSSALRGALMMKATAMAT